MFTVGFVEHVEVTILIDNSVGTVRDVVAEWGFSALVKVYGSEILSILYDLGQSGVALLHNMKVLKVNPEDVRYIILSHGHFDHTGGLKTFIKKHGRDKMVIAHPKVFEKKVLMRGKVLDYIGVSVSKKFLEKKTTLITCKNPLKLCEGVLFSGQIERYGHPEFCEGMYVVRDDGEIVEDKMLDDSALIINVKDKGLVIITGCGHSNILNIVKHAERITGVSKLYAVIGGLHLLSSDEKTVSEVLNSLISLGVSIVCPTHCSGLKIIHALMSKKPEIYIEGGVGRVIKI
ncbi:MAG: MBL fold metallo-hydrolase [Thermoprotei archaeon ex4572_64]|nr:MAG: MBL fold metallo-hydrolase [Thermoprotei archaeon ex4572_64]